MEKARLCLILIVILAMHTAVVADVCNGYDRCSTCMNNFDHCGWCVAEAMCHHGDVSGPTNTSSTCATWLFTASNYTATGSSISMNPNNITAYLRGNHPLNVSVSVTSIKLPIDLVITEDLSGSFSDDVVVLRQLATNLTQDIQAQIHPSSRFGFTAFIDKPRYPFGSRAGIDSACSDLAHDVCCPNAYCGSDYVYRNYLSLTNDTSLFVSVVNSINVYSGWDYPESQLDGMFHSAACDDLDWGPPGTTRRMVMMSTDAEAHSIYDGWTSHLTGRKDPSSCLVELGDVISNGDSPYFQQDFVSLGQLREVLLKRNVVPVIAATERYDLLNDAYPGCNQYNEYPCFIDFFGYGGARELSVDSSNFLDVIWSAYNESASIVQFGTVTDEADIFQASDPLKHENVQFDDVVEFVFTFTWTKPMMNYFDTHEYAYVELIAIGFDNFYGFFYPNMECDCAGLVCPGGGNCNGQGECDCGSCFCEPGVTGTDCSCNTTAECDPPCEHGSCECGVCDCTGTNYINGPNNTCECPANCLEFGNCGSSNTSLECCGNGNCVCGVCNCSSGYYSTPGRQDCNCIDDGCPGTNNCSGTDHGTCICGTCECNYKWMGANCNCSTMSCPHNCKDPDTGEERGVCECGECKCNEGWTLGPDLDCNCNTSLSCPVTTAGGECNNLVASGSVCDGCGDCECAVGWGWPMEIRDPDNNIIQQSYAGYISTYSWLVSLYNFSLTEPVEDCSCSQALLGVDQCYPIEEGGGGVVVCGECYCAPDYYLDNCACGPNDTCSIDCGEGVCNCEKCPSVELCGTSGCYCSCVCNEGYEKNENGSCTECLPEYCPEEDYCPNYLTCGKCVSGESRLTDYPECGWCKENSTCFNLNPANNNGSCLDANNETVALQTVCDPPPPPTTIVDFLNNPIALALLPLVIFVVIAIVLSLVAILVLLKILQMIKDRRAWREFETEGIASQNENPLYMDAGVTKVNPLYVTQ